MKFLVDENLPEEVAEVLRGDGHDAITVFQRQLVSADDPVLGELAQAEGRAVVTADLDFANTQMYRPRTSRGSSFCAS